MRPPPTTRLEQENRRRDALAWKSVTDAWAKGGGTRLPMKAEDDLTPTWRGVLPVRPVASLIRCQSCGKVHTVPAAVTRYACRGQTFEIVDEIAEQR